jgi:transcription elongation factor GreA
MGSESHEKPALRKLARNQRFDEVEAALLAEIEIGGVERDEIVAILNLCFHRGEEERVEAMMWMVLSTFSERYGPESGISLLRGLSPLMPQSAALRDEALGYYRAARSEHAGLDDLLGRTVGDAALPLDEGMRRADALFSLPPGTFFRERRGKVAGRALGLSPAGDTFAAEFEAGAKFYDFRVVGDLEILPEDDFRVEAAFRKERVREAAERDPAGLIEKVLRTHGPLLSYRELRSHLNELVPGGFAGWWNQCAPQIRRSPWIEVSGGTQPSFEIRRVALSHEARFRRELADAGKGLPTLLLAITYLEEAGDHAGDEPELTALLAEALIAESEAEDPAIALGALALLDRLARFRPQGSVPELPLPSLADPAALMSALGDPELESAALEFVHRRQPEGFVSFFVTALPACAPEVCEEIARDLRAAGREDALLEAARTVLSAPSRFTGALLWLWKDTAAGGLPVERGGPDRPGLLAQVLLAADRAFRAEGAEKQMYQRIRSVLSSRDFEAMRAALRSTDLEGAKKVADTLRRCIGFSDDFRGQLTTVLTEVHPKLFARDIPPWELTEVIWTTHEGVERKRKELYRLLNEVLPGIAEAIGRAAAEGDLSENAEYKGNLELRERMTERANSLQAEIAKARVIPREMAGAREITVGSLARVRDGVGGKEKEFRFLGPWDADAERGIFSYRASLGLAFMGKKPGDTVPVEIDGQTCRFEILSISSAV